MFFSFFLENFLHACNMVWLYSPLTLLKFSRNFASYLLVNFTLPSFTYICVAAYKMLGFRMTFQTSLLLVIWPPSHPFLCPTLPSPFLLNPPIIPFPLHVTHVLLCPFPNYTEWDNTNPERQHCMFSPIGANL